jgi:hypothetical protein
MNGHGWAGMVTGGQGWAEPSPNPFPRPPPSPSQEWSRVGRNGHGWAGMVMGGQEWSRVVPAPRPCHKLRTTGHPPQPTLGGRVSRFPVLSPTQRQFLAEPSAGAGHLREVEVWKAEKQHAGANRMKGLFI